MSAAMTQIERQILAKKIEEVLAFNDPLTIADLREKVAFTGNKAGFTRLVKNRFIVSGGLVYLPGGSSQPSTEPASSDLCRKMAKVIDRMAQQIEALEKEIVRLRNNGAAPTLSERAKKALVVYGD